MNNRGPMGRSAARRFSTTLALMLLALFSGLLFAAEPLSAQQPKSESKTESDGRGGKITTTYSDYEGKHYVETVRTDEKGRLTEKRTDTSGPDGTLVEIEDYDPQTGQMTSKLRSEVDPTGKITSMQTETYNNGILVKGELAVLKNGDKHRTVVKKWSLLRDRYVDVPVEEQEAERAQWRKFDEDMEKQRLERGKFFELMKSGKISFESSGTGETIGHVADLNVKNLTNESLAFSIPPVVLESKSGRNQDYVVPEGENVALKPGETNTVALSGTCLERDRAPEPPGKNDDIVLNDGEFNSDIAYHLDPREVREILQMAEAKYRAVDKLEEEGRFKDFPYQDKEERKQIAVQWSTWEDPRISELTSSPPVEKEDFKQNVEKQAKEHGPVTKEVRRKLDKGTDAMWDGIELTSEKAKDLEAGTGGSALEVSDQTGEKSESPAPQTEEKKIKKIRTKEEQEQKEKRKENRQKWDDWKKKEKLLYAALAQKALAQLKYNKALQAYLDKNEKYQAAKARWEGEGKKGNVLQNPDYADAIVNLANTQVELEQEFQKTPEGKKAQEELNTANKDLEKADTYEKEAKKKVGIIPPLEANRLTIYLFESHSWTYFIIKCGIRLENARTLESFFGTHFPLLGNKRHWLS